MDTFALFSTGESENGIDLIRIILALLISNLLFLNFVTFVPYKYHHCINKNLLMF